MSESGGDAGSAIWRERGNPLVGPTSAGPLSGESVAVKDLFAVEGFAIGAGVPAYLAQARPEPAHAPAVAALLAAGASVWGIAQTDEFAYSIAGRNPHYGTPPNPAVPGGLPGGSSSGPAAAVATGQASIGLGTDTGGSIRVPASYQGLWGLRSTHGAVSTAGLVPLAPSFDAVGWLARSPRVLGAAARASLAAVDQRPAPARFAEAPALSRLADHAAGAAFASALTALGAAGLVDDLAPVDVGDVDLLFAAFRTLQGRQAWRTHGAWIDAHPGALGTGVAARFAWARSISADDGAAAAAAIESARERLEGVLDGRTLLLPAAATVAPPVTAGAAELEDVRGRTLRLTCVAGITGRPALSVPALSGPVLSVPVLSGAELSGAEPGRSAPVGLCLVGPRFSDLALIDAGERFAEALGSTTLHSAALDSTDPLEGTP